MSDVPAYIGLRDATLAALKDERYLDAVRASYDLRYRSDAPHYVRDWAAMVAVVALQAAGEHEDAADLAVAALPGLVASYTDADWDGRSRPPEPRSLRDLSEDWDEIQQHQGAPQDEAAFRLRMCGDAGLIALLQSKDTARLFTFLDTLSSQRFRARRGISASSPSVREVSRSLDSDEGLSTLSVLPIGTLLIAVPPGGSAMPSRVRVLSELSETFWYQRALGRAGQESETGLVDAVFEPGTPEVEASAALARAVGAMEPVTEALKEAFNGTLPRRLVLIPHGILRIFPFDLAPALHGTIVEFVDSGASLVKRRAQPIASLGDRAVIAANPTGDLALSPAEVAVVQDRLATTSVVVSVRAGRSASTEELLPLARSASLVHLTAHGRAERSVATNSALLMAPNRDYPDDPILHSVATAEDWNYGDVDGNTVRVAVNGSSIVSEVVWEGDRIVERSYENGDVRLWEEERDGVVRIFAERWTADEIERSGGFGDTALAVLSACSLGADELPLVVNEREGVVAALEITGTRTVVVPRWPIRQTTALVFVALFYEGLMASEGARVNVRDIVHTARDRQRALTGEEVASMLLELRDMCPDPQARLNLKVFSRRAATQLHPFANERHWGAFTVAGEGILLLAGTDDDPRRRARKDRHGLHRAVEAVNHLFAARRHFRC